MKIELEQRGTRIWAEGTDRDRRGVALGIGRSKIERGKLEGCTWLSWSWERWWRRWELRKNPAYSSRVSWLAALSPFISSLAAVGVGFLVPSRLYVVPPLSHESNFQGNYLSYPHPHPALAGNENHTRETHLVGPMPDR